MISLSVDSPTLAAIEAGWLPLPDEACTPCKGTGHSTVPGRLTDECPACDGSGRVPSLPPAPCLPHPCPECENTPPGVPGKRQRAVFIKGKGTQFVQWDCSACGGSGVVAEPIEVKAMVARLVHDDRATSWKLPGDKPVCEHVEFTAAIVGRLTLEGQPIPVVDDLENVFGDDDVVWLHGNGDVSLLHPYPTRADDLTPVLAGLVVPGVPVWRCRWEPYPEPVTEELCLGVGHEPVRGCRGRWPLSFGAPGEWSETP